MFTYNFTWLPCSKIENVPGTKPKGSLNWGGQHEAQDSQSFGGAFLVSFLKRENCKRLIHSPKLLTDRSERKARSLIMEGKNNF